MSSKSTICKTAGDLKKFLSTIDDDTVLSGSLVLKNMIGIPCWWNDKEIMTISDYNERVADAIADVEGTKEETDDEKWIKEVQRHVDDLKKMVPTQFLNIKLSSRNIVEADIENEEDNE